jgi:hypothetical protein
MKKKKRKTFFSPRDGRRKKWNKRLERFTWRTKIIYCHLNAGTIIPPLPKVYLFFSFLFPPFYFNILTAFDSKFTTNPSAAAWK